MPFPLRSNGLGQAAPADFRTLTLPSRRCPQGWTLGHQPDALVQLPEHPLDGIHRPDFNPQVAVFSQHPRVGQWFLGVCLQSGQCLGYAFTPPASTLDDFSLGVSSK